LAASHPLVLVALAREIGTRLELATGQLGDLAPATVLSDASPVAVASIVFLGLIVGFISGLFGVGGGFLLTPLLGVLFGIPLPIAVGTGLCQMVGSSTVGALRHRKLGQGEPRVAILMIPGSLIGVWLGSHIVETLGKMGTLDIGYATLPIITTALYFAYISFLSFIAWFMFRQGRGNLEILEYVRHGRLLKLRIPPLIDLPNVQLRGVSTIVIAYIGLFLGLLSGLLGIGGGIVLMPILLYGVGFSFRQAAGTGVVVTLLTAVVGTVAHARAGNVDLVLALVLLVGSGVSAQFGAIGAHRFSARALRRGLGAVVLITVGIMVADLGARLLGVRS
jgi:uncharacterized membrane protein YfcA